MYGKGWKSLTDNRKTFFDFYQEYLGLDNGVFCSDVRLCKCKYRDIPINKKYFYKMIATEYNGDKIISHSPEFNAAELKSLCAGIDFEAIGVGSIRNELKFPKYGLSYMYRMLLNTEIDVRTDKSADFDKSDSITYKYLEDYRKYIALNRGELVGYCKVSDVIADYGNLVVWVEEPWRRSGIGENLVKRMMKKCYEEKIVPMYVVKTDNHASVSLAKKLGFQVIQREFVISFES